MSVSNQTNPFLMGHLPLFEQIDINIYGYDTIRSQINTQKEQFTEFENGLNKLAYTFSDIFDNLVE